MALLHSAKSWGPAEWLTLGNAGDMGKTRPDRQNKTLLKVQGFCPFIFLVLLPPFPCWDEGSLQMGQGMWGETDGVMQQIWCLTSTAAMFHLFPMVTTRPLVGAYLFFLLLSCQGKKWQESRELVLTSELPWGREEKGVYYSFQKIKITNRILN